MEVDQIECFQMLRGEFPQRRGKVKASNDGIFWRWGHKVFGEGEALGLRLLATLGHLSIDHMMVGDLVDPRTRARIAPKSAGSAPERQIDVLEHVLHRLGVKLAREVPP